MITLLTSLVVGAAGILVYWQQQSNKLDHRIDFNRDIRPILNKNCISCHGGVKQAGEVSFIYREQVLGKGKSDRSIVIPGKPSASELIARVTSNDPEVRMPPSEPPLQPEQILLLRRWIEEGAPWEDYWAFVSPKPQPLPEIKDKKWGRQPLDRFILARLEKESLAPSPEADKAALLRRLSFDLTGLPPTPQELSEFLIDSSEDAYEKQVDRLLASPRYGERWASMWLDLARYGDSKGFEKDRDRSGVWPYRDWVIEALNQNLPYDQFVIEQLAGDLFPSPTLSNLIATSFHRQTPANDEGGTDDEEFRLAAVMDRVATTWSILNGITMNCVQCHSHPYDPIRQVEYYKSLTFFNTSRDADILFSDNLEDDWPVLHVPQDKKHYSEAAVLQHEIKVLRGQIISTSRESVRDDNQWQVLPIEVATISEKLGLERRLTELQEKVGRLSPAKNMDILKLYTKQIAEIKENFVRTKNKKDTSAKFNIRGNQAEITGTVPVNSVFELTTAVAMPIVTALRIEVLPSDIENARHSPEKGFIVDQIDAWVIQPDGRSNKIEFRFFAPDSEINLEVNMARMIEKSSGQKIHSPEHSIKRLTKNSGFMAIPSLSYPRWVVGIPVTQLHLPPGSQIRFQMTHLQAINSVPAPTPRIRFLASGDPNWSQFASAPELKERIARLEQLEHRVREISTVPLPVMQEQPTYAQRQTLEFERGSFLNKTGPALSPDVPALFPRLPNDAPRNRLMLAKWFFSPKQPLTARVLVNRFWEQLFGTGIVETLEDFGSAGEIPSHPALLDWLALHFQNDLQWDMKALLRVLVTSATYRQSAETTPALQEKDPYNRLLAHGPQQRLSAEMIRDQALFSSGLLNTKLGGPPVMPLQPEGVWSTSVNSTEKWINATDSDRYRRAVYTYIKRTSVYPSLLTFDASNRQLSLARRIPTNTPLQALVTLNDPVYREAAEALAKRISERFPADYGKDVLDVRLNYGAQCVLSRDLTTEEYDTLRQFYNDSRAKYDEQVVLTEVASILLNLDSALTR